MGERKRDGNAGRLKGVLTNCEPKRSLDKVDEAREQAQDAVEGELEGVEYRGEDALNQLDDGFEEVADS